ncbi:MAG TPA: putative metal-dependent hydrolase [Symbiobacteriaceae bacterium]
MTDPRYPIGKFAIEGEITPAQVQQWLQEIDELPAALDNAIAGLSEEQLDVPYREGGWTVRQVVHHLADAHLNNYVRVRLALTEENPVPKAWDTPQWAELPDARTAPAEISLQLLEAVHRRWALLLRSIGPAEWARGFAHPTRGVVNLAYDLGLYDWHGRHHVAHITGLRERMGW